MKRNYIIAIGIYNLCAFFTIQPCMVTNAGNRIWDTISRTDIVLDSIESKVDRLGSIVSVSSVSTFTVLQAILNSSYTIQSEDAYALTSMSALDIDLRTLNSMLDVVDNAVATMQNSLQVIHVNDFGGTWTLINAIQNTLSSKADVMLRGLNTIESKFDQFTSLATARFIATSTLLRLIDSELLSTIDEVQYLNTVADIQLNEISTSLQTLKNTASTINSRMDVVNVALTVGFAGTFTALKVVENTALSIDSAVDVINSLILIDSSGTATALNALLQAVITMNSKTDVVDNAVSILDRQVITIDSKTDFFSSKVSVVDSKVIYVDKTVRTTHSRIDIAIPLLTTIQSTLDAIDLSTVISEVNIIDSKVNSIDYTVQSMGSSVDVLIRDNRSIQSLVDGTDSYIDVSIVKVFTINSKVIVLDRNITTINSKMDIFSSYIDIDQSKIDTLGEQTIASEIDRVNSLLDKTDSTIDYLNVYIVTVNSKLDVINRDVSRMDSLVDRMLLVRPTIESKIDYIQSFIDISIGKANTVLSQVDNINSDIDIDYIDALSLTGRLSTLHIDFQQTWTALQALQNNVGTLASTMLTINNRVDAFTSNVQVDLSGTYTALTALSNQETTIQSKLDYANTTAANLNCISTADLSGTFTVLNAISRSAASFCPNIFSRLDTIADILSGLGIPVFQSDIGTTGTLIIRPGRYFFVEDILFNPISAGLAAIVVASNNVELFMLRHTIRQIGSLTNTAAIRLNPDVDTVYVIDGNIHNVTGNGIEARQFAKNIFIRGMNIMDIGGTGIDFSLSSTTVFIENNIIAAAGGNGIRVNNSSDITISECMLTDNGVTATNHGILMTDCQRVLVSNCMSTTNRGDGYHFSSTTTHLDTIIDYCKSFENAGSGIYMARIKNSIIKNCVCSENGASGIELRDCQYLDIVNNFCMDNRVDSIVLATDSVGTNLCYVGENSFLLTGSVHVHEKSGSGANSVLSNFALSTAGGDNYATDSRRTYFNFVTVSQSGTFPTTDLVKWYNVSMTT